MEAWLIWILSGAILVFLEFILPGAIIIFLGIAAIITGGAVYYGWITTIFMAFICWFMTSIFLMIFLRSIFIKYFEGDSSIQNVDEDLDFKGALVEVVEEVLSYKEGRVKLRDTTWMARSDENFIVGSKALVEKRAGNYLIIKSV